jgi:acetoin utilization deacetylase AcuC-like enzyme
MATAFITHADCMKHDMGTYHPECPTRLSAIDDQLISSGIAPYLDRYDAPVAEETHLARVHPRNYINAIKAAAPEEGIVHLDPDTAMSQGTLSAALRAAGAGVLAVDLVLQGKYENAFCSVRPPGHHATRNRAMGFCFFNNIAVAAKHALEGHGLERVAIVDWDVHHGNGTEDIFAGDDRVLMASTFQHPFYPYSGADDPAHNMVNVPMPAGAGSQQFREVVEQIWLPALEKFRPQMLFISAGFDAHIEDDMAMMRLVDQDYGWTTQKLVDVAERHGNGRVVSMLEGGYALSALGRSVVQHLRALGGF